MTGTLALNNEQTCKILLDIFPFFAPKKMEICKLVWEARKLLTTYDCRQILFLITLVESLSF